MAATRKKQIPKLVQALVKKANDQTNKVKNTILEVLTEIGNYEPNLVVRESKIFLEEQQKAPEAHRIALLTAILKILQNKLDEIEDSLAFELVALALCDMTKEKNVNADWQGKASSVLVALGMKYPQKIVSELLALFGPGVIPHYFVMKTLGDLALANPVGTVPLIMEVFARLLPVLASIKMDNLRWVFASSVGCFCEAITAYKINVPADQRKIDVSTFAPQAFAAYEMMFTNWLPSKTKKVRLVSIQAIGATTTVMDANQLGLQIPKLIPTFAGMYKKEKLQDHFPITHGLCNLLSVATQSDAANALEPLRDSVLNTLFPLICRPPDFSESTQVKNHNEMLRSVEILAKKWMDEVLTFLFAKCESKEPVTRNGALLIMKHLVTRTQANLEGKKELIVSAVKGLAETERELDVKKSMAQVIIAMANENYLSLYGGEALVEFIILSSSITDAEVRRWQETQNQKKKDSADAGNVTSPGELRSMCDHILSLMTTTIPSTIDVLWPYLLEPLTKPRFTTSMAVILKCISHIAEKKRKENATNYWIDFDHTANINLPKPQKILARLIVLSNLPFRRGGLVLHLLSSLQHLGPILHPGISTMWDATIPKLITFLNNNFSSGNKSETEINKWEGLIRRLFTETAKIINDDSWMIQLTDGIIEQWQLLEGDSVAKKAALKTLGCALSVINNKEYVKTTLSKIFRMIDHSSDDERAGCAQGFAFCSTVHLDVVLDQQLEQLKAPEKESQKEKSSGGGGFFSSIFGGSKKTPSTKAPSAPAVQAPVVTLPTGKGSPSDKVNTTILAYGYITAQAKQSEVLANLDEKIIKPILPHLDTTDTKIQQTIVQAIELIGQTVHPDQLQSSKFILSTRDQFVKTMLNYIRLTPSTSSAPNKKTDKKDSKDTLAVVGPSTETVLINQTLLKLSVLSLNACTTLTSLEPVISPEIEQDILTVTSQYYSVQAEIATPTTKEDDKPEQDNIASADLIITNLDKLYTTILIKDPSIACLKRLIGAINSFFTARDTTYRTRSISTYVKLLKKYVEIATSTRPTDREITGLGSLVAKMIPRVCDTTPDIRGASIEVIQLLFYIQWMIQKIVEEQDKALSDIDLRPPKTLAPLTSLRKKMQELQDQNDQFSLAHTFSGLLAKVVTIEDLTPLIIDSLPGLVDHLVTSARGTCVIIFGLVSARGSDIKGNVIPIVVGLLDKMANIVTPETINGTLHALKSIAKCHLSDTYKAVLAQEIPHKPHVTQFVQLLARDPELAPLAVKYLMMILNTSELFENDPVPEGQDPNSVEKRPTLESQAATICLGEMFQEEEMEEIVNESYAPYYCTLMLRLATAAGFKTSIEYLVTTWKHFYHLLQEDDITQKLEEAGAFNNLDLKNTKYLDTAILITSNTLKRHPNDLRNIFKILLPYLKDKAKYDSQKLIVTSTYSEMMNQVGTDNELLDQIVTNLLGVLPEPLLKITALRGLGNIVNCAPEQIHKYSPTIMDALISPIDDKKDDIALESMISLTKVFSVVEEARISPVLINISNRIIPAFNNPNDKIRESAAYLFSSLARFGGGPSKDKFIELIHKTLVPIILHVNDSEEKVQKAFKKALFELSPLLQQESLITMMNSRHIFSVESDIDYNEFIHTHLTKFLCSTYPEKLSFYIEQAINPYFNSDWDIIKANAVYFVGSIMKHTSVKKTDINVGTTIQALLSQLTDKSSAVRHKAAEACCMLQGY